MSLLFPEKLRIHLAPGIVVLARTKQAAVLQSDAKAVAASDEAGAQPLLDALTTMLESFEDTPAAASVTLSSRLAPVMMMPWRDDACDPQAQALLAASRFAKSYGGAAADWDCIAADSGFGRPWITAGIRQDLVSGLKSVLSGARVQSIAPLAVALFNAQCASLPVREAAWLLVPEADRLVGWYCEGRVPKECISLPAPADDDEPVEGLLRREAMLRGLPATAASLYVAASQVSGPLAARNVQRLLPRWRCEPGVAAAYPLHWLGGA